MSKILQNRDYFKPLAYPWAWDGFVMQEKMKWMPTEVPMHKDVQDWNQKLSSAEKNLLTQLFRFFTQGDLDVAKGYYNKFIPAFRQPELRMMMGAFANMEGIHVWAYSLLLETVGMPEVEYRAFTKYEAMAAKHEFVEQFDANDTAGVARNLAVYSAFTEGLQLFSSFAILMNFGRFNKMTGMNQIVAWSIRDESLHVEGMIKLFRTLIEENPHLWTDDFKLELYDICRKMVELEDAFIDLCFEQGGIEGLTAADMKKFIRYIANRRLNQLGLKDNYDVQENPLDWLDWILNGKEHANFFETRGTEYGEGVITGSWSELWAEIDNANKEQA